jgi:hypothetical protein
VTGLADLGSGAAGNDADLEVDLDGWDPFADAAAVRERHEAGGKLKSKEQRPRGRPMAATNRKTVEFEHWYRSKGYRDPLEAMAQWLTADPIALQAWFAEHERAVVALGKKVVQALPSLLEIIKEQHAVARELGPYLHGKKPIQVQVIDERLPTLIIDLGSDQLSEGMEIAQEKALSAGLPMLEGDANEINDLSEAELLDDNASRPAKRGIK